MVFSTNLKLTHSWLSLHCVDGFLVTYTSTDSMVHTCFASCPNLKLVHPDIATTITQIETLNQICDSVSIGNTTVIKTPLWRSLCSKCPNSSQWQYMDTWLTSLWVQSLEQLWVTGMIKNHCKSCSPARASLEKVVEAELSQVDSWWNHTCWWLEAAMVLCLDCNKLS